MIEVLQQYGLSEKEAKVYLAGLSLGSSPGSTIARYTGENRVTVYSILKELVKKGIFTTVTRQNIAYFSPIAPDLLVKNIEDKYIALKNSLPLFAAISEKASNKPKITYYEGIEGLKNLYNEVLKSTTPLFAFLSDEDAHPNIEKYLNNTFVTERRKRQISAFVLASHEAGTNNYRSVTKKDPLTTIKITPESMIGLSGEIILYEKRYVVCALYSKDEMVGFMIDSKQFYKSLHTLFMFIWNILPGKKIPVKSQ